ncbi:YagE family protein [Gregarina niphandrodes]|uniref:YagE family protein n=1 Tax=Gregarina niphandrodes TaxID=110365 RepID=A0A023BC75_GRENI|nr:YagE family protein [Gregarina niphandrodes]EZG82441.1 YagE family protein [Gregarina niphandrodes]|eukprot:XP_011129010.1 YagE family protein [Gregarina niphandrodes]
MDRIIPSALPSFHPFILSPLGLPLKRTTSIQNRTQIKAQKLNFNLAGAPLVTAGKTTAGKSATVGKTVAVAPRKSRFLRNVREDELQEGRHFCIKFLATSDGYNLQEIYDALVEQGVWCQRWKDQDVVRFRLTESDMAVEGASGRNRFARPLRSAAVRSRSADSFKLSWRTLVHEIPDMDLDWVDCFVFRVGTIVLFGLKANDTEGSNLGSNLMVINAVSWFLTPYSVGGAVRPDWTSADTLHYVTDLPATLSRTLPRVLKDRIIIRRHNSVDEKLAIAIACSQSCQLAIFEESMKTTVAHVTSDLMGGYQGQESPPPGETMKALADLYLNIIDVNMVLKLMDVPDYFWEHPSQQNTWLALHEYLDVTERLAVLNSRCDSIKELLADLTQATNTQRETRLTWVCILWIIAYIVALLVECLPFK